MAITPPMAARWVPRASCTNAGTNALRSGPVTPANRPPRPMMAQVSSGARDLAQNANTGYFTR